MKNSRYLLVPVLLALLIFTGNCKKDNSSGPTVNKVDTVNASLKTDSGSIGLIMDTRPIARKGYHPDHLDVSISGDFSKFSKTLSIDPATYISVLKYYVDSLTQSEIDGFKNGVDMDITVYDNSGRDLGHESLTSQIVDDNEVAIEIDTDLPAIYPPASLSENMSFIIQAKDDGKVLKILQYNTAQSHYYIGTADYNLQNNNDQRFYFKHIPGEADSVYCMVSFRGNLLTFDILNELVESNTKYDAGSVPENMKLYISPDTAGWVKIHYKSGGYLHWTEPDFGYIVLEKSTSAYSGFRLLNGDVNWDLTDMGTDFEQPVLPPAKLEFAYKATLKNCSPAELSETVGRSETRTQSFTSGTEESLELFSSQEYSAEVTAGVDVDATFFGKGATYSLEATAGYTYTTSSTETKKQYWEATNSKDIEISRERVVQIGPETAIEVYDAVQTLNNVKMPFTKKFRLKGTDPDGNSLTGKEINFQLYSNMFGGVVTSVGADYVDFTVKGTTTIDQMMEVETQTKEIKGACGG